MSGLRKRNEYRAQRRETRRLKLMNTLSPDFTGESNLHIWAEPKKVYYHIFLDPYVGKNV